MSIPGVARFRVNVLWQRGNVGGVMRLIPARCKTIDELELPQILKQLSIHIAGSQTSELVLLAKLAGKGIKVKFPTQLGNVESEILDVRTNLAQFIALYHAKKQ